jgi:hypothetical protein
MCPQVNLDIFTNAYRLVITISYSFFFALFNLSTKIVHVNALIILWNSTKLLVEASILKHAE